MRITKTNIFLILIFLLALLLRIIAANSIDPNPDEMAYVINPLNMLSAGRLSTFLQSTLFSYLTDIGYQLFGFSAVTSRLPSILFSSLTVFVIFLISKEIFRGENSAKKIGMAGAFLFAVSGYSIKSNIEPDITAFFFIMLSLYFFIRFLKAKNFYLYFSAIALGLAVLSKILSIAILPAYIIFYFIYTRKKDKSLFKRTEQGYSLNKPIFKTIVISALLFVLVFSPVLIHNYLAYQGSGVTDYYFSTMLGIGENIAQGMGGQTPWNTEHFTTVTKEKILQFLRNDAILFCLGILGLIYGLKKKHKMTLLLLCSILSLWIYLAGRTGSDAHYVIFLMLLSLPSGMVFFLLGKKIKEKLSFQQTFPVMLIIVLALSFFVLGEVLRQGPSSTILLREYAAGIPDNALVVVDPLVYRGIGAWALNDKHYLEGQNFPELADQLSAITGMKTRVPFYYIECGRDSKCGWKPEDYARAFEFSESLSSHFRESMSLSATLKGHDVITFHVYKGEIGIVPEVYDVIDQQQRFFFYPVGWKHTDNIPDVYRTAGSDGLLLKFGFLVMYLNVLLALLSVLFVIYRVFGSQRISM